MGKSTPPWLEQKIKRDKLDKYWYPSVVKPDGRLDEWLYFNPWKDLATQLELNGGTFPYEEKRLYLCTFKKRNRKWRYDTSD